jgi:hypothetical protein
VRIEAAKKQLESTPLSIHQVMFSSGYNDDKTFRMIFKRYTGLTPLEYRKKYNREMALARLMVFKKILGNLKVRHRCGLLCIIKDSAKIFR